MQDYEYEEVEVVVNLKIELIIALEDLDVETRKNMRMSNKLEWYYDQFEYLYIQLQKAKKIQEELKSQVYDILKGCNKSNEEIIDLKTQLEAILWKEEALRLHMK